MKTQLLAQIDTLELIWLCDLFFAIGPDRIQTSNDHQE